MSKKSIDQTQNAANRQTTATERLKAMQECLKVAAQIRQELEGRKHSNSTELISEDRQR